MDEDAPQLTIGRAAVMRAKSGAFGALLMSRFPESTAGTVFVLVFAGLKRHHVHLIGAADDMPLSPEVYIVGVFEDFRVLDSFGRLHHPPTLNPVPASKFGAFAGPVFFEATLKIPREADISVADCLTLNFID